MIQQELFKLYSIVVLFGLSLGTLGCGETDDCCTIVDVDVNIFYQNDQGECLINSNEDFQESNIRLYYKNGDQYESVYDSNLDHPRAFYISESSTGDSVLTVFPSGYYDGNYSTTLIELNLSVVDTLICMFDLSNNNTVCTNAWLNGVEMNNRFLEVVR